jgi:sugar/nucleoside kinase (ribokinase family)
VTPPGPPGTAGTPVTETMRVIALGVHVVDVLVRPVQTIPARQGGQLVDEIRITAAGPAGGFAVTLAKLGARVRSAGAIGTDALGDVLIDLLRRAGVDTALLIRRDGVQTSASVLPIRPDGSRPAFHVVGANATYSAADAPWEQIAAATHLHLGAPEFMGGDEAAKILSFAREHGVTTSADILAPGDQAAAILDWIAPMFGHLDYLLPNDEQVLALTSADDLVSGCRSLLDRGVGCVAATRGGDGAVVVGGDETVAVPAFAVDVVDTTGCGDAFSAGFLRALALGRDRAAAARLGCAAAGLVAGGLGSDHGDFDLDAADAFAARTDALTPTRSPVPT